MATASFMRPLSETWGSRTFVRPLTATEQSKYGSSSGSSGGSTELNTFIKQLQKQQASANAANEARYAEGKGIYQQALSRFGEGGTYGQGVEAQIERGRTQSLAQGSQALASSGLYNTTVRAGLGKKYEEEVAQPARAKLEDVRAEKLTEAEQALAGFVERREDTGPSMDLLAQLIMKASQK